MTSLKKPLHDLGKRIIALFQFVGRWYSYCWHNNFGWLLIATVLLITFLVFGVVLGIHAKAEMAHKSSPDQMVALEKQCNAAGGELVMLWGRKVMCGKIEYVEIK